MNRHERRAAAAQRPSAKLDPIVAIHEAGHAVARVLTAGDMGYSVEQSVACIEVGMFDSAAANGKVQLYSQAVTSGPMFSAEILAAFKQANTDKPPGTEFGAEEIADVVEFARQEGADIASWLRSRMLIMVFGSAAEASYTGRSIIDVWNSYESSNDFRDAEKDGRRARLSRVELESFVDEALHRSAYLLDQPHIKLAISKLANALPASGKFSGKSASQIVSRALSS